MRYLIIGIGSIILLICSKCHTTTDPLVSIHYHYINQSNWDIMMNTYDNRTDNLVASFAVAKGDTLLVTLRGMGGASPFRGKDYSYNDSINIILGNKKYI